MNRVSSHKEFSISDNTYAESDNRCVVRFYRSEVISDDGHLMIVNTEFLNGCTASINQSKSVCFATGEHEFGEPCVICTFGAGGIGAVEVHLAVD